MRSLDEWEHLFASKATNLVNQDAAHDSQHFRRVAETAKRLCAEEQGKMEVVIPAAWLHDFIIVPKDDPRRSQASSLSARAAIDFLESVGYPYTYFPSIAQAIESHSYSAGIKPETLEAKIVQDADRLDALGAIGIARCLRVGGQLRRSLYGPEDPFCEVRTPDDTRYTLDHFYTKLFRIVESLQTSTGQTEGRRRLATMDRWLSDLRTEIH